MIHEACMPVCMQSKFFLRTNGRTDGLTKVFHEALADLKSNVPLVLAVVTLISFGSRQCFINNYYTVFFLILLGAKLLRSMASFSLANWIHNQPPISGNRRINRLGRSAPGVNWILERSLDGLPRQ